MQDFTSVSHVLALSPFFGDHGTNLGHPTPLGFSMIEELVPHRGHHVLLTTQELSAPPILRPQLQQPLDMCMVEHLRTFP